MREGRPEEWKEFYDSKYAMIFKEEQAFEAGADAMLEALMKAARESPTGTFVIDSKTINIFFTKETK